MENPNLYSTTATQLALLAQKQRVLATIPQCLLPNQQLILNQNLAAAANLQLRSNAIAQQQSLLNMCPMALQQLIPHQNQLSMFQTSNNSLVKSTNYYEGSPLIMASSSQPMVQLNNISPENKVDPNLYYNVFVGDLSPEVDNSILMKAFEKFGPIIEAKVMIDQSSGKSRSFGFVTYWKQEDASKAIEEMNGQMVGKRPIRTNWATRQKGETRIATYEEILKAGDGSNASVYLKNVADAEIRENFEKFGSIKQIRLFSSKNYGFVVFETKENAAHAIHELSGKKINGHIINCSWGRIQEQPAKTNSMISVSSMSPVNLVAQLPFQTLLPQLYQSNAFLQQWL